jgi:hypothetical protein
MKETVRTLSFVGVALVSAALAWYVSAGSAPAEAEAFAKVGTEFYPDFTDPTQAGSLEITSYDKAASEVRKFKVQLDRGRWRIPSHHGYPADAKDQLEKAAGPLIGITRQALAGRRSNAHERFGVLQPPETSSRTEEPLEGLGQRIVLKDKAGNVLADYILGKRVAGQENLYFVRIPGEDETYHAEVNLDVSTKFGDWVEKDLLKLDRNNLLSMEYSSIEELRQIETPSGRPLVVPLKQTAVVHRDETGTGSKWQVDDLDPETEEINTSGVSAVQTALDSLELNGVRPKLQGLTADLAVDMDQFPKDQNPNNYFRQLQRELSARGYFLAPPLDETEEEKFALFGKGGELIAKTNEGLAYHMLFGEAFAGTEKDIEVGKTEVADEEGKAVTEPESEGEASHKFKTTQNRYLFIRVEFDESLLGDAPKKPEEPQKPEDLADEQPQQAPQAEEKEKTPEELQEDQRKRDYESQLALYRNQLVAYEEDTKEYQKKLKAGKAKAEELNNRFREWYYVIPASSYENLTFTRAEVVKDKEKDEPESSETPGSSPLDDFLKSQPGAQTPNGEPKPAIAEKPTAEPEAAKEEQPPKPE